jgi:hypothetical protein
MVGALLTVTGCDPAALVKSKVPEPLKDVLTFGSGQRGDKNKPVASVDIVFPKANRVYGATETVNFQANVSIGEPKPPAPPVISWTLTSEPGKPKAAIGKGAKITKRLEPGTYEAEITVEVSGQKITKNVAFRVALQMTGKIATADAVGIPGVEVAVMKLDGETVLSQATSDGNGSFAAEVPAQEWVVVTPKKNGIAFFPASRTVKFTPTPVPLEFTGTEAQVDDIRLTEVQDPAVSVAQFCPGDKALLSFRIKAKIPPKTFDVALVGRENETEQVVRLEQDRDSGSGEAGASPESRTLKVRLPRKMLLPSGTLKGRLRLIVNDEKGSVYAVDTPTSVEVDLAGCFLKTVSAGSALLQAGKLEESVAQFDSSEKLARDIEDSQQVKSHLHQIYLNRCIALLLTAQAEKPKSAQRLATVDRALLDLNHILRANPRDEQGLFLKGVAHYLAENYRSALTDFDSVLLVQDGNSSARLLRALAGLQTSVKKNVASAVDDLTEVLAGDPGQTELRKVRGDAVKLIAQYQDRKDDERIDTSEISLPETISVLDLKKFVHK